MMITTTMLMVSSSFILINAYQTGDKIFESLNAAESIIISNAEDEKVNSFIDFLNNQDEVKVHSQKNVLHLQVQSYSLDSTNKSLVFSTI